MNLFLYERMNLRMAAMGVLCVNSEQMRVQPFLFSRFKSFLQLALSRLYASQLSSVELALYRRRTRRASTASAHLLFHQEAGDLE